MFNDFRSGDRRNILSTITMIVRGLSPGRSIFVRTSVKSYDVKVPLQNAFNWRKSVILDSVVCVCVFEPNYFFLALTLNLCHFASKYLKLEFGSFGHSNGGYFIFILTVSFLGCHVRESVRSHVTSPFLYGFFHSGPSKIFTWTTLSINIEIAGKMVVENGFFQIYNYHFGLSIKYNRKVRVEGLKTW